VIALVSRALSMNGSRVIATGGCFILRAEWWTSTVIVCTFIASGGSPTVILEAGVGMRLSWYKVQPQVASLHGLCVRPRGAR
jgi:hypothetical protein